MQDQNLLLFAENLLDQDLQQKLHSLIDRQEKPNDNITLVSGRLGLDKEEIPHFFILMDHLLEMDPPQKRGTYNLGQYYDSKELEQIRIFKNAGTFEMEPPLGHDIPHNDGLCSTFLRMNRKINLTHKLEELQEILDSHLRDMEILCASIFLFEGTRGDSSIPNLLPPESARRIYSLEEGNFPDEQFFIDEQGKSLLRWVPQNCNRLLMPLAFGGKILGFMIIQYRKEIPLDFYEDLRIRLCSLCKNLELKDELQALSLNDELTKLYNARGFETLGEQLMRQARRMNIPLTLFYCDIDGLGKINQHKGRNAGDLVLKESASLLQSLFRKNDVVGRVGSDEFAILALGVSVENEKVILERLQLHLSQFIEDNNFSVPFTMKTTLSRMNPGEPFSLRDLLSMADFLMTKLKEGNK